MSVDKITTRKQLNTDLASLVKIRTMTYLDLSQVTAVEVDAYPHPWTEGIFRDCLRVGHHAWVMILDRDIIGYGVVMLSLGEAHVLNICVHPDYQSRGLGRYFLRFLIDRMMHHDVDMILLEVRRSNQGAQYLYQSEGFHELGVRKSYYPVENGREDAIILAKYLPDK